MYGIGSVKGRNQMTDTEFKSLVQELREYTFLMTDEEATPVIDEHLKEHPELLDWQTREWFIKYC
jgi:hypothetical protein